MVALPERGDPTLEAVDRAMEERERNKPRFPVNLSAGVIGHACERFLWLMIQPGTAREEFDAATLRRFADGHACEDIMAARLRLFPGLTLETIDPATGKQFAARVLDNRLKCFVDGFIVGLLQAPVSPHIWEGKSTNPEKFRKIRKLKDQLGEKATLQAWDPVYYAQAVLSMELFDVKRHYLTVCTPGARDWDSCRTEANPAMGKALIEKARRIIRAGEMPEKVSDSPKCPACMFCRHKEFCHASST